MRPRRGHRFRHLGGVQVSKDLLNATQLGDGVDSVCPERLDQLILVVLRGGGDTNVSLFGS